MSSGKGDLWDDFRYTPHSFLRWALDAGWSPGDLPVGVIYTFQTHLARFIAERPETFQRNGDLTVANAETYSTVDDGPPILVACLNPGGASMATQLEHLRYLGDETRFAAIVGTAGALVPGFQFGQTAVVGSALRADSLSDRYMEPGTSVDGDPDFVASLAAALGVAVPVTSWTVAVPYRQTDDEHLQAVADGAEVVEMEIATLYAVAAALKMRAAAAVVVSDISRVEGWHVDWSDSVEPTRKAFLTTVETMRELADAGPAQP